MKKIFTTIDSVSKVVLIYLLLASVWILFSDKLVSAIAGEENLITAYQTYKGLFYVLTTSLLLYVLIKRINSEFKQGRDQLQHIMDQSPAVICTLDENGRFKQVNSAAQEIWGYPVKDLLNKKFLNFLHPDDIAANAKLLDKVRKVKDIRDFENRHIRPDGSIVWMKWTGRWNAIDKVIYCIGINVSALKEAERKEAEERNLLRTIIDNIPHNVFVKDLEGSLVISNKAINEQIFGAQSENEVLGKTVYDLFDEEVAKSFDEHDKKVIEKGEVVIDERKIGSKKWLHTTKVPLRNEHDGINGLVGIARDITEKKKARDEIKRAKERYEMVVKATTEFVFDWDIVKNELNWSSGIPVVPNDNSAPGNPSVKDWTENIHPEDLPRVQESLRRAYKSPSTSEWETEYRYLYCGEKYITLSKKASILRDEAGMAVRMVGSIQDVTELRRKEQEIQDSLKEKEVLLLEVHHRVKNNLAVISSMLQLQAFDEEDEGLKNKLLNSVSRIQSIANIHEHLYQNKSFSSIKFFENLKSLITQIIDTVQAEKEIELTFNLDNVLLNVNQAMPVSLIVNEVITNILKHAFRGIEKGKISTELIQAGERVVLKIIDDGQDLPEGFVVKEGKTLGLKLIGQLAKQLNAEYSYENVNKGSAFTLEFKKSEFKGAANALL